MSTSLRVLLVEDSNYDAILVVHQLRRGGYDPDYLVVDSAERMKAALANREWDVILCDYSLPQFDAFDALKVFKESGLDLPFIIVSGTIDQDTAVAAMKAGAHDYMLKDNLARLTPAIRRELEEAMTRHSRRQAEEELAAVKEELASQLSDMTVLHELSVRLSSVHELQAVLDEILIAVTTLLNTDMGVLKLHDVQRGGLFVAATRGATPISPASVTSIPLFTRSGELLGSIETYRLTPSSPSANENRLLELYTRQASDFLENVRLYEKAQEANRLKDEFVAMVSHELRTPLTPIMGAVHMMRSSRRDEVTVNRALDMIERNVKTQAQIIDDLLDISRIVSGKLRLHLSQIDIRGVIEAAITTIRPAAEAKDIRLEGDLSFVDGMVLGDPDRLQQIIWNLLSNAVKFTPKGGSIRVELSSIDTQVEIRVTDTGIGILPEFLPYVFDRFRQADSSTTRAHGGLGLGLSIVRQLVELHGGDGLRRKPGSRAGRIVYGPLSYAYSKTGP